MPFFARCERLRTTRRCSSSRGSRGRVRTHEWAPRVLIANSNLVGEWATWEEFRRLEALGLTMYGQMTAGSWIYIGSQGIVQGTLVLAEIARRRFGGSLAGTVLLTAGLGGMGGAQPLAVTMNEGVALCVEVDRDRIRRRLETRYLDEEADDLADAVERYLRAKRAARAERQPVRERGPEVLPELLRQGFEADVVTDQTSARPAARLRARRPDAGGGRHLAREDPEEYVRRARRSAAAHLRRWSASWTPAPRSSTTATACAPRRAGRLRGAFDTGFVPAYIRPLFCEGKGRSAGGAVGRTGRHSGPRPRCSAEFPGTRASPTGSGWPASASRSRDCRADLLAPATAWRRYRTSLQRDGAERRACGHRS